MYQSSASIFALFLIGSAFSNDIASLVVCRFFAGIFGSSGINFAAATISDMTALSQRGPYMSVYYTMPLMGAVAG